MSVSDGDSFHSFNSNDMENAVPVYRINDVLVHDKGNEDNELCNEINHPQVSFILK